MSTNTETVERYLDGFRRNDHAQILSCLTDDIEWTVYGAFRLHGKEAYDAAIEGPGFIPPPTLEVVRIVEQGDVIMAELTGSVRWDSGEVMRMSMAEVFVMRGGLIAERRASAANSSCPAGSWPAAKPDINRRCSLPSGR